MFDTIVEFLDENTTDNLRNIIESRKTDIAFLADIFSIFNELNLTLQGDDTSLIKAKSKISAFIKKLQFFRQSLVCRNFHHFKNLEQVNTILDTDISVYYTHLKLLEENMVQRFQDLLTMEIPNLVLDPFSYENYDQSDFLLQEELINIKNDFELKPAFSKSYISFWLQERVSNEYPIIWSKIHLYFLAFHHPTWQNVVLVQFLDYLKVIKGVV